MWNMWNCYGNGKLMWSCWLWHVTIAFKSQIELNYICVYSCGITPQQDGLPKMELHSYAIVRAALVECWNGWWMRCATLSDGCIAQLNRVLDAGHDQWGTVQAWVDYELVDVIGWCGIYYYLLCLMHHETWFTVTNTIFCRGMIVVIDWQLIISCYCLFYLQLILLMSWTNLVV